MNKKDYYEILGVSKDSSQDEIKKAYRKLALKLHPDVNHAPDAQQQFLEICEAYEVILSEIKSETNINISTPDIAEEDLVSHEEIHRQARERAAERARIRYEKLKAEKEFFQNNDVFVLLRYIGNYLAIPFSLLLILGPVYLAITEDPSIIIITFFFWIIGYVIFSHIYTNRKTWFRPGKIDTRWKCDNSYHPKNRRRPNQSPRLGKICP